MEKNTASTLRPAIVDFCGFALLMAALNSLVAPDDWIWLKANPNPWLLLPVYMGCRYGLGSGAVAGILLAGIASLCAVSRTGGDYMAALLAHRFLLLGFVVGGVLTGAVRTLAIRRAKALQHSADQLAAENQRLRADFELVEETRYLLQERLALFGAETAALDTQLRALFAPGAGAVFDGLLRLLSDVSGVEAGCVLAIDESGQCKVAAARSSKWDTGLKVQLPPLATEARGQNGCVTWSESGKNDGFLAAIPMGPNAIVLIEKMPFTRITKHVFVQIETIVQWVGQVDFERAEGAAEVKAKASLSSDEFDERVKLARETFEKLRLPSMLVKVSGEAVKSVFQENVRFPQVFCLDGENVARVLLPMEGVRDADQFASMLREQLPAANLEIEIETIGGGAGENAT